MKIILEFEDRSDAQRALKADDLWLVIQSLDEKLRQQVKYVPSPKELTFNDGVDWARTALFETLERYGIDPDEGH